MKLRDLHLLGALFASALLAGPSLAQRRGDTPRPDSSPPPQPRVEPQPRANTQQRVDDEASLQGARALFQRVDQDRSGQLDTREADHAGIDARTLPGFDVDQDGSLSWEEFVVGHRQVRARAGKTVAADLDAEATRLQALRRARETGDGSGRRSDPGREAASQTGNGLRSEVEEARKDLNQRLRSAGVDPREGHAAQKALEKRIQGLVSGSQGSGAQSRLAAGPAAQRRAAAGDPEVPGRGPALLTLEEKIEAAQKALDTRLRNAGVDERLGHHQQGLLLRRAENATGGSAAPAGTLDEKLEAAQDALNRRLRQADVDARQGHFEQGQLLRRAENAQGAPGDSAAQRESVEERARLAQEALNRRLRQADPSRPEAAPRPGTGPGLRRAAPSRPESPPPARPRGGDTPAGDRPQPERPRGPAGERARS
jgi:hypothetical protein